MPVYLVHEGPIFGSRWSVSQRRDGVGGVPDDDDWESAVAAFMVAADRLVALVPAAGGRAGGVGGCTGGTGGASVTGDGGGTGGGSSSAIYGDRPCPDDRPSSAAGRDGNALDRAVPSGCTLTTLIAVANRVQAVVALAMARFVRSPEWVDDGARSAASWLAGECRLPRREVARWEGLGAIGERLAAVAAAWAGGTIGSAHVAALASVCNRRTAEAMARDQRMLVGFAQTLSYSDFRRALAYWVQHVDPDGCEEEELQRQDRRSVSLHQTFEGSWFGELRLDPVNGAIVAEELRRLEQQLFDQDVVDAALSRVVDRTDDGPGAGEDGVGTGSRPVAADTDPVGVHSTGADALRRTAAQRRADALVAMAIRSRGSGLRAGVHVGAEGRSSAGGGVSVAAAGAAGAAGAADDMEGGSDRWDRPAPPGPLFTVLVDWPTVAGRVCQLANGHPLTPGALVPWLGAADLERAVWRGQTRIDIAATSRLFTGATRRAIEVRDGWCTHPYCSLPADRCQVDHIVAHVDGGLTTQGNGQLLCAYHNRRKELLRRRQHRPPDGSSDVAA